MRRALGLVVAYVLFGMSTATAAQYGFGKVVKHGSRDKLVHHESLRVYRADTVGFVYIMKASGMASPLRSQPIHDASRYTVTEGGTPLAGLKVVGEYHELHRMGHRMGPGWRPQIYRTTIYVRLPKPMVEGKAYSFRSQGIGKEDVNVSFTWSEKTVLADSIKVNQFGYLPQATIKSAYLGRWLGTGGGLDFKGATQFHLLDLNTGEIAYTGQAKLRHQAGKKDEGGYKEDFSGENVYGLFFSDFKKPGAYCVVVPGVGRSYSFRIAEDVYAEPLFTSIRALFHQRCPIALTKEYTPWARPACKQHGRIAVVPEYDPAFKNMKGNPFKLIKAFLDKGKAAGNLKYRDVSGGYHDAGDFDRRDPHLMVAVDLCTAYEANPEAFIDRQFILPESGNGVPDILDEAYFGVSFYLDNQWPDGGVPSGSEAWEHPRNGLDLKEQNNWLTNSANEVTEYVLLPVRRDSCLHFAIAASFLGRLMQAHAPVKAKGDKLVAGARKAYELAKAKFPPQSVRDKWLMAHAAIRLLQATQDKAYHDEFARLAPSLTEGKVDCLLSAWQWPACAYMKLPAATPGLDARLQAKLKTMLVKKLEWPAGWRIMHNGYLLYKNPWQPFSNGSASTNASSQMALLSYATGHPLYRKLLEASADFCLGANPMGQVQCTGLGQRHILHPLHLDSMNDALEEPVPGIWVYGPGTGSSWFFQKKMWLPYPSPEKIPLLYRYVDIDQMPGQTEFTVTENLGPAVMMFGMLAPENPRPYAGPLPAPK